MKLYIATTTLNFDAIVSTESISPTSFYQLRNFGISFCYDKASLMMPNSILLTDAFPVFSIGRGEVAHRPMVIAIDDSNYPGMFSKVKDNDGYSIYQTGRTIYLSPLSCEFFFYSEGDKRATLCKAESIIESKYCLYDVLGAIKVFDGRNSYIKLGPDAFKQINDFAVPDSSSIKEDIVINKAKGFIVSYMIGASLSVTKESARLQRLIKDLKNGIYSMGTNERSPVSSKESIFALAQEANAISKNLDIKKEKADCRVREYLDSVQASSMLKNSSNEEIVSFLKAIDLYKCLFDRINPRFKENDILSLVRQAMSTKDDADQDTILNHLQSYADSITQRADTTPVISDLFILGIDRNVLECNDVKLNDDSRRKVEIMFNLFSGYGYKANDIRANRIDYIYDAGSAFFPEKNAKNQAERDYINAMLDNLEHASSFDIHSTSSEALMGLAIFMRTPDSDIDKMVSFLVSNEINDPRIAFGLWGIFYGYSNIPQVYFNAFASSLPKKEDKVAFSAQLYQLLFSKTPISHSEVDTSAATPTAKKGKKGLFGKIAENIGFGHSNQDDDTVIRDGNDSIQTEQLVNPTITNSPSIDLPQDGLTNLSTNEDMPDFNDDQEPIALMNEHQNNIDKEEAIGHPYTELWNNIIHIIEDEAPKKKEILEYKNTYPAAIDRVFNNNETLIKIRNGIDAIPASCAISAWNKAKAKIRKAIKQKEDDESSMFQTANPSVIESLQCAKTLSLDVIKRLNKNWDYTATEKDIKEHIRYFMALSRKEGRGDLTYSKTLTGIFVDPLAGQIEKELYRHFGIQG